MGTAKQAIKSRERMHWLNRLAFENALGLEGCVVCNHLYRSDRKEINGFLYESMMDPDVRRRFLEAGGFCQTHFVMAWQIEKECWPDGGIAIAILCGDLLDSVLDKEDLSQDVVGGVSRQRTPGEACIFCAKRCAAEASFLSALEDLLDFESVTAKLTPGRLCLGHTEAALITWRDATKRARAAELARAHVQELVTDLGECVRKYDDRFVDAPKGKEQEAVPRAIRFLVGGTESR